jgi:tryptophan-rich sensory protein
MNVPIITAAVITVLVLGAGGATTSIGPWYRQLRKPWWNPPDWVFGPAWTLILGLAAWAGVLAWQAGPADHQQIAVLFGINILLHLSWSPLFFNLRRPDWALIEIPFLWLSILSLILGTAPLSGLAPFLLVPYLLWVTFAAGLNLAIVQLNPSASVAALPDQGATRRQDAG